MLAHLHILGLIFNLAGVVLLALGDVWFSRSVLVHLDALEENLSKLIAILRTGGGKLTDTGVDLRRDRGQDRARFVKLVGWALLGLGFVAQLIQLARELTLETA